MAGAAETAPGAAGKVRVGGFRGMVGKAEGFGTERDRPEPRRRVGGEGVKAVRAWASRGASSGVSLSRPGEVVAPRAVLWRRRRWLGRRPGGEGAVGSVLAAGGESPSLSEEERSRRREVEDPGGVGRSEAGGGGVMAAVGSTAGVVSHAPGVGDTGHGGSVGPSSGAGAAGVAGSGGFVDL